MKLAPHVYFYRHWFRRRPLAVSVLSRVFHWRVICGLQVGPWFVGAIKGSEAVKERDTAS